MGVIGTNTFVIKSYKPKELGLDSEEWKKVSKIEVRQKYFHSTYIPCFGLGKSFSFKKKRDENRYELPEKIKQLVIEKNGGSFKTKWYTFAGPILFVVLMLVYFTFAMVSGMSK